MVTIYKIDIPITCDTQQVNEQPYPANLRGGLLLEPCHNKPMFSKLIPPVLNLCDLHIDNTQVLQSLVWFEG